MDVSGAGRFTKRRGQKPPRRCGSSRSGRLRAQVCNCSASSAPRMPSTISTACARRGCRKDNRRREPSRATQQGHFQVPLWWLSNDRCGSKAPHVARPLPGQVRTKKDVVPASAVDRARVAGERHGVCFMPREWRVGCKVACECGPAPRAAAWRRRWRGRRRRPCPSAPLAAWRSPRPSA